jgi:hypothetical protein
VWSNTIQGSDGVAISLNPAAWDRYPVWYMGTNYNTASATVTQNAAGDLVGTKTTATGGTNWILGLETTPNYDLQNSTLRYQWKLNGNGSYAGIYVGTRDGASTITNSSPFTVAWYSVGYQISNNTWIYTQLTFSPTGYDYSYSYTGFGNTDFLHGTSLYGTATWDRLAQSKLFLQLGDNYNAGAYFEAAQAQILTGGAYVGYLTGTDLAGLSQTRTLQGRMAALYIDPNRGAGYLVGALSGGTSETSQFSMGGNLYPVQMVADAGISAQSLYSNYQTVGSATWGSAGALTASGSFAGGSSITPTPSTFSIEKGSISTQPQWGVWKADVQGTYLGTPSDTWRLSMEQPFNNPYTTLVGTLTTGTQWSNNSVRGSTVGYGADITGSQPTTWIAAGETAGYFYSDPDSSTWQTITTGPAIETTKFLQMAADAGERAKLQQLNIPAAEVGTVTLLQAGPNSHLSNLTMAGVKFFAFQSGQTPGLWGTGAVSGSYYGDPTNATVGLTGGGLTADFTMKTWNLTGHTWLSLISNGSGYLGSGYINFHGAGAGIFTDSGGFSGTAAGVAEASEFAFSGQLALQTFRQFQAGSPGYLIDAAPIQGAFGTYVSPFTSPGTPVDLYLSGTGSPPGGGAGRTFTAHISGNDYVDRNSLYAGWMGGIVLPDNTMTGMAKAVYKDAGNNIGILTSSFDGTHSPQLSMWTAQGSLTAAQLNSGYTSAFWNDVMPNETVTGTVAGQLPGGGLIPAQDLQTLTEHSMGQTATIQLPGQSWGIFTMALGGTHTNPGAATTFSLNAGGNNWRTADYTGLADNYWLIHASGDWGTNNTISGPVTGAYLNVGGSAPAMGAITGSVLGSWSGSDPKPWDAFVVGEFHDEPVFSSQAISGLWVTSYDYGTSAFPRVAVASGYLALNQSLWSNPNALFMGTYSSPSPYTYREPALMAGPNWLVNGTPIDGGGYYGYMAGVWDSGSIRGRLLALAVNGGNAGYVEGPLSGNYSEPLGGGQGVWYARGPLTTTVPYGSYTTNITGTALASGGAALTTGAFSTGGAAGVFTSSGASIASTSLQGGTIAINDTNWAGKWGVWYLNAAGGYGGTPSANVTLGIGGSIYFSRTDAFSYWVGGVTSSDWGTGPNNNSFTATLTNGRFMNATEIGSLSTEAGGLFGVFNNDYTWAPIKPTGTGITSTSQLSGIALGRGLQALLNNNGSSGDILTSPDGVTWTRGYTGANGLTAIAYSQSYRNFVAVGAQGTVVYSNDGTSTSWYSLTNTGPNPQVPTTLNLLGVANNNSYRYVAVGDQGVILVSDGGYSWTQKAIGASGTYLSAATFGNSIFVAVGSAGTIQTSSDSYGNSWNPPVQPTTNPLRGVTFGNNLFVAVGDNGTILTSTNGTSWTARTSPTTLRLSAVTYRDNLFTAVGAGGTMLTSPDGITWTARQSGTTADLYAVTTTPTSTIATGAQDTVVNGTRLWQMAGVGLFGGVTPLYHSTTISGETYPPWNSQGDGAFSGLLGTTSSFSSSSPTASISATMMGTYSFSSTATADSAHVWSAPQVSVTNLDKAFEYYGHLGGLILPSSTGADDMRALFAALYVDNTSTSAVSFLKGSLTGTAYRYMGTFAIDGTLNRYEMPVQTGITPGSLAGLIDPVRFSGYPNWVDGGAYYQYYGQGWDIYSSYAGDVQGFSFSRLPDQGLVVWQLQASPTIYSPYYSWMAFQGFGFSGTTDGYFRLMATGNGSGSSTYTGKVFGYGAVIGDQHYAQTYLLAGDLLAGYVYGGAAFMAGIGVETRSFLSLVNSDFYATLLESLGLPSSQAVTPDLSLSRIQSWPEVSGSGQVTANLKFFTGGPLPTGMLAIATTEVSGTTSGLDAATGMQNFPLVNLENTAQPTYAMLNMTSTKPYRVPTGWIGEIRGLTVMGSGQPAFFSAAAGGDYSSNAFSGTAAGLLTPITFMSEISRPADDYVVHLQSWDGSGFQNESGYLKGLFGPNNPGSLWGSSNYNQLNIDLIGQYSSLNFTYQDHIFDALIAPRNFTTGDRTTMDGGSFVAWLVGSKPYSDFASGPFKGTIAGLYIDPNGWTGLLLGDFGDSHGVFSTQNRSFWAQGSLYTVDMSLWTDVSAADLGSKITNWTSSSGTGTGAFTDYSDNGTTTFFPGMIDVQFMGFPTVTDTFGVWKARMAGSYAGVQNPYGSWYASIDDLGDSQQPTRIYGFDLSGYVYWDSYSSDRSFQVTAAGYGASIEGEPKTWVSVGKVHGTFDPVSTTFQAMATGPWIETKKFLDLATNDYYTLQQYLNVPAAEVGRVTMTGSAQNYNVTMQDVRFFSFSGGQAPVIWATNNVFGNYNGVVTPGQTALLWDQLQGGLTANFTMKTWDVGTGGTGKWLSTITNGTGNLSSSLPTPGPTDRNQPYTGGINFRGAGAGTITPTGTGLGSFSGTAAGVAKAATP